MRFYKKKCHKLLITIVCGLVSSTVFATSETITTKNSNNPFPLLAPLAQGHVVFELGGYLGSQGQAQYINIQDLIGDNFTLDKRNYQSGLIGLGYFVDGNKLGNLNMSYGVNLFYLAPTAVTGNVIQEGLFNNLSYHYNISNTPLYLMAKTTFNLKPSYALTVDIGIGPNFMKTYDFQETSLDGGVTLPDYIFAANTTTTLSATVGVSVKIDHALGQLPVEIGYRFFYLGQGHFMPANDQVLNKLNTGTVYANAITFAIIM